MTLPVVPDVETILANSVSALRDQVLPEIGEVWPRSCTRLVIASLEYAIELLRDDHGATNRAELAAALDGLRATLSADAATIAGGDGSVFEQSSRLLVWAQENPGPDADAVRAALHPVLVGHLDREAGAAMPLIVGLVQTMWSAE
jgi:hypothetical protein